MRNLVWLVAIAATACGSSSKNKDTDAAKGSGSDSGSGSADAPSAPAMITIMGTATAPGLTGSTAVSGATIAAYPASDEGGSGSAIMMTTTDGSGNFTLTVSTGGSALDGYLKATASTYLDTYLWPPAPLTANFSGAAVEMLTTTTESLATGTLCGVSGGQLTADALIGVKVETSAGVAVGSAAVTSSTGGTACYDGTNGDPSRTVTSTGSDGVGLLINATAGSATLTAKESGDTFASHTVYGVAGAFTTTLIIEQ
jgi:hypothetical protein